MVDLDEIRNRALRAREQAAASLQEMTEMSATNHIDVSEGIAALTEKNELLFDPSL